MAEQPIQPPLGAMVRELLAPDHTQTFFRELVARNSDRFQNNTPIKRGVLYSSLQGADVRISKAFPALYFCKETVPSGSNTVAGMNQDLYVIWNWSSGEDSESTYNAEISQLADATTNAVFARSYNVRRDDYEASPYILTGTPLTALIGVEITQSGNGYTHAEAEFDCNGDGAAIDFVIANGQIISAIVIKEGENFDLGSVINIIGDGSGAKCVPIIQPVEAVLTSQKKMELPDSDPMSHEFVRVLRVYEVLPGPWVPATRYDDRLGPIQMRRRAVLNTGQIGGIVLPTGTVNFEGRDGSSVVSIEIQENFSNGTGLPGDPINPPYPVMRWAVYQDERGDVHRTSQIVVESSFHDENATFVRQFGNVIKTWYEAYPNNPFLWTKFIETWVEVTINDQIKTSEFGGGVADVTERTDEPGVQVPETGLMVISSETRTKSPNEQTLKTVKNPAEAWPINHGIHTDETTGIVINFTKQVIQTGTPYPGINAQNDNCALMQITGPFIEDQPYDEDKTIRIISFVDLSTIPKKQCRTISHPVNFPPQLLSIEAIWTDTVSKLANAQATSANVSASSGSAGGIIPTSKTGFHGYASARLERSYFYGQPNAGLVPTPLKIFPSSGAVVLTQTHSSTSFQNGDDGGTEFSDSFQIRVDALDIRDHLVNLATLIILNATHHSPAQNAIAVSGGGTTAAIADAGTLSTMDVRIPQSTPPSLISGQEIVYEVDVREHPFNIFEMNVIFVTIP